MPVGTMASQRDVARGRGPLADVSLDDKYTQLEGRVFLSGIQALVRFVLDQNRADRRRGLNSATFISGYQGSPLGGYDKELERQRRHLADHHVHHQPALNEELGATSVWGSQLTQALPGPRYDGVVGVWYGKNPGLDRACDAIRHANFSGTSPTGGVVALVGDDPGAKSSTLPSAAEAVLAGLYLPTLYPGNVQELVDYGLHAVALSRACGLWVGMKVATNVADAAGTVEVGCDRLARLLPEREGERYRHTPNATMLAPHSLELERSLFGPRLEAARAYARASGLNGIEPAGRRAWLGLVASGKTYHDLRQALADLGLTDADLEAYGLRLLKLGMVWPLEPQIVREFARGLEEILVVEEKLAFVERAMKDVLYGGPDTPRIVGKTNPDGTQLLPAAGELDADLIARVVGERLGRRFRIESVDRRLDQIAAASNRRYLPLKVSRTPFFCSGCPHSTSTPAPDGTLVGAGIGCHTMIALNPAGMGEVTGITQMGGEGAQWIGMAPFTGSAHFVQNLGDGTYHHSGSLAVRAAVAAGVNITYKIFYNDAVAMTGGQQVEGLLTVSDLTRELELEGVRKTIVTTDDLHKYRGVQLARNAEVRDRSQVMEAQQELAHTPGVTVLLHDQQCAAEKRRLRKRGKLEDPPTRVFINERVCEGCGDCGEKSGCLSVQPVDTEFGRKTQIHQSSCNKDYSCLDGDCPSFITVVPGKKRGFETPQAPTHVLPEPERLADDTDFTVRMMGIGGTGVVTVSQILGMASHLERKHVHGLDQTGLSQKGGPVVSDVRIASSESEGTNQASAQTADLYLGFDLLGATDAKNLTVAHPQHTIAVVSTSAVPTGQMVIDSTTRFPALTDSLAVIELHTQGQGKNVYLDAQKLAQRLFGDHMLANLILLGAAFQRGLLPVSAKALEQAIRLNGVAVDDNLSAFAWGRACVACPDRVAELEQDTTDSYSQPTPAKVSELVDSVGCDGELHRLVEHRATDLVAYQNNRYARDYVDFVRTVYEQEQLRVPTSTKATEAVARQLYKLMAYKDEYEVARLQLDAAERAKLRREFGSDAKVWFNLHPPVLRALGLKRKLKLGGWFVPAFKLLRALRFLRRTPLDPFGQAKVRMVERKLIGEYRELVERALSNLSSDNHRTVVELCELPDKIRGYEQVKLANVERFRTRAAELVTELDAGGQSTSNEADALEVVRK